MNDERPTVGSLFSGIGGMDLGLERAGFRVSWQVEWDGWCQRVLAKHWPDVPRYGDITAVDWSGVERVDVIAGGFPCQPFSNAGKRLGKSDDRWLWPAFAAAIGALRPRLVLVENVPGLLAGHGGMGSVLGDLAALGYDAEWDCIPAAAVGAPHLRYRVWIVAYPHSERPRWASSVGSPSFAGLRPQDPSAEPHGPSAGAMADAQRERLEGSRTEPAFDVGPWAGCDGGAPLPDPDGNDEPWIVPSSDDQADRQESDAGSTGLRGGAGPHREWAPEPNVGRVAHGVPSRVDRLRGLGNAVVPQVVEVIGRQLMEALS